MQKALYVLPRALGVLSILYVSIFALDAFAPGVPPIEAVLGFAIHLIPSAVLAIVLAIAWRYERFGGALFIAASLLPFFLLRNPAWVNALLAGPFLLTGLLFFLSSQFSQKRN